MNVFVVLAHPEHHSFNAAMFRTAVDVLTGAGHDVRTFRPLRHAIRSGVGQAQFHNC